MRWTGNLGAWKGRAENVSRRGDSGSTLRCHRGLRTDCRPGSVEVTGNLDKSCFGGLVGDKICLGWVQEEQEELFFSRDSALKRRYTAVSIREFLFFFHEAPTSGSTVNA